MPMVLELTAISGTQLSKKLTVSGRVTRIGSASSNELVIHERQIEPRHAEIHQMLDRFFLVPLTPQSHGVSLNGLPVSGRSRINPGDVLTLGVTSYRVAMTEQAEQEFGAPRSKQDVPRLGEYFVRRGLMNSDQIKSTAQRQVELQRSGQHMAFGQLAFELGYINRGQLEAALNEQRNDFNERFRD